MKIKDLIAEAVSLPVEDRALVLDSLLKALIHQKQILISNEQVWQNRDFTNYVQEKPKRYQQIKFSRKYE